MHQNSIHTSGLLTFTPRGTSHQFLSQRTVVWAYLEATASSSYLTPHRHQHTGREHAICIPEWKQLTFAHRRPPAAKAMGVSHYPATCSSWATVENRWTEATLLSKQSPPSPSMPQSMWEEPPRQLAQLGSTLLLPILAQAGRGLVQGRIWCGAGSERMRLAMDN